MRANRIGGIVVNTAAFEAACHPPSVKVKDSLRDGVNKYVIMLTNLRSLQYQK